MTNLAAKDQPEYGKVYDLMGIASGKTWAQSEVKPDTPEQISEKKAKLQVLKQEREAREKIEAEIIAKDFPDYDFSQDSIKIGDIFVDSWGYDQTNIDYYQVVSISPSGKTARVKPIHSKVLKYETSFMSNKVMPDKNNFKEPLYFQKTGNLRINKMQYGLYLGSGRHSMQKWDGRPDTESHYA